MAVFPTDVLTAVVANNDNLMFSDTSDANKLKKSTPWWVVSAGISAVSSDNIAQWSTNLYLTTGERVKIAWVEAWAQVNQTTTVNWQQGAVVLTQDEVWDGTAFVRTNNNFTNTNVSDLNNNTIHRTQTDNPHNVTKTQIGLSNVTNDVQLSQTAGNFNFLTEKSDIQLHLNDKYVLQDSDDANIIKSVTNQTDLIWKSAYIQIWWPSINYYDFTFVSSTTYNIQSLITVNGNIYYCKVSHQSSGSFSADLSNWFWEEIGGATASWNVLSAWNGAPVDPGINIWDVYVDVTNGDLYYWDWANWVVYTSPQNFAITNWAPIASWSVIWETVVDPTTGVIYIWNGSTRTANQANGVGWGVAYDVGSTLWDKMTYSVGTGANLIAESSMWYDVITDTFSFDGSNITYNDVTETRTWDNITNLPVWASHTYNLDGTVNNNYWATYVENNVYTDGATINNDGTVDIVNAPTYIQNTTGGTYNYTWVTEVYDATSNITYEGDVTFEWDINVTWQVVWANRAYIEEFTATAWQTDFTVANTPASDAFVRVSTRSWLYGKQWLTRDYTVSGSTITLNTPALLWDVITIQYVESLGTPIVSPVFTGVTLIKKWVTAGMTGTSLVVADVDSSIDSIITRTAQTSSVWFIEIVPANGSFTINSSASETGLVFNYVITK